MLYAQFFKKLLDRLHPPGLHILVTALNAVHGFAIVLLLPCEVIGQHVIERALEQCRMIEQIATLGSE